MVRVGLFGVFDGDDAVTGAVVRAELARRLPELELRVYTPTGRLEPTAIPEPLVWVEQPFGPFGAIRQEELAATLDAVVVTGTVELDPGTHATERLLVEGLGSFEPDVEVVWFAVTPEGAPSPIGADLAREALARRSGLWVSGVGAQEHLADLGVEAAAVPHPALALPRLAAAADMPAVVERLRAASALPGGDYVGLDEGAPDAPGGVRLPPAGAAPRYTTLERVAAIAGSAVFVGASPVGCAIAVAYGRPAVWTGSPRDLPMFAVALGGRGDVAAAMQRARSQPPPSVEGALADLDAAFDELAKNLDAAVPPEGRAQRAIKIRLREEERAAAAREQELLDYNASLNTEIVAKGPRFTALWRKIHEADRHYHWHKLRADRGDEEIAKLWHLHEQRTSTRLKRSIRSTRAGDAIARALGAGPLTPPPPDDLGPEGPDAPTT